jgi:SAM-dependent methyltransferase
MLPVPRGHFSRSRSLADYDAKFGEAVILRAIAGRRSGTSEVCLLEIGCGEGRVLMELRKAFPSIELHGINRNPWPAMQGSASLLHTAMHYGIFAPGELSSIVVPAVHFYDAEALRFPAGYFDIVISQVSVPYVPRKERLLEEVWRTLKPGGTAFLHIDSTRTGNPDYLSGDTPTFVLYRDGERVPAAHFFERLRSKGFDLQYQKQPFRDGDHELRRFLLVMRKNLDAPLQLDLAFDRQSSFDVTRLHETPQDWKSLWGYRSVYRIGAE